jgi:tRNA (cmo5U34)-methyltransferase
MSESHWSEEDSVTFAEYSRYFIPRRDEQIAVILTTLSDLPADFCAIELGCGDGTLARAILDRFPHATLHGLDASPHMLKLATAQAGSHHHRFVAERFELADSAWWRRSHVVHAVVSSLAVHHLTDAAKLALFRNMHALLEPGGVLTIADVVRPASEAARLVAAHDWDTAVRAQIDAASGPAEAYDLFVADRWNMYDHLDEDPADHPATLAEQLNWLKQAGFFGVDCCWLHAGHAVFGGFKSP